MFSIVSNLHDEMPDVAEFVRALNAFQQQTDFFDQTAEIIAARAPGRLDLMGGIADYSGALVLEYPIKAATFAALQKVSAAQIQIVSILNSGESPEANLKFNIEIADLSRLASADYSDAQQFFRHNQTDEWAAYVAGVFIVLMRERQIDFDQGCRILIKSNVPEGKGVSSSAALEVAAMQAVNQAFNLKLDPRELAVLCQTVENRVVGAPCGVMDQMASACGETDKLLALQCQPAELLGAVDLPADLEIWGIDSGIRHSVAGADYGSVRAGAFIGYRIIAEIAGFEIEKLPNNQVKIRDDKWHGYLANITPTEFEENFQDKLPEKIAGAEFLAKYHGTTDNISKIILEREYQVRAPTAHPIRENRRVHDFARLLTEPAGETQLAALGELMFQSHASYSACGLGSAGTDLLVELVKKSAQASGLYGAKITGGGSGGTVAVLGRRGAGTAVEFVAREYESQTKLSPTIFSGSSPGAGAFGFVTLTSNF